MSYANAFAATMKEEGGYSNRAEDPGGETYMGISRVYHPGWPGWDFIDKEKAKGKPWAFSLIPGLTDMVRDFYRVEYWERTKCHMVDQLSPMVAQELFDSAVNVGRKRAATWLQVALNMLSQRGGKEMYPRLDEDGSVGRATLSALDACLRSGAEYLIFRCQNGEQYAFYKTNPQYRKNRGWFART